MESALECSRYTQQLLSGDKYNSPKRLTSHGWKMYSQFDEDGIIHEIYSRIGYGTRRFLEFGVGNGLENNTLALMADGWSGAWIEASETQADVGRAIFKEEIKQQKVSLLTAFVYRDNINRLISEILGSEKDLDLISIDIDGNDYWVWEALSIEARVVVIEYNAIWQPHISLTVDYNEGNCFRGNNYFGASLKALETLGRKKGYSLVGCSLAGANAFFVRDDLLGDLFHGPYTAEEHYEPPRYFLYSHIGHPTGYGPLVTVPPLA